MYKISQIKMPLSYTDENLKYEAAKRLRVDLSDILSVKIIKKSVDARKKDSVCFVLSVLSEVRESVLCAEVDAVSELRAESEKYYFSNNTNAKFANRPVVVGTGPAGLFAALALAKAGLPPLIIERGKKIDARVADVEAFERHGALNPESNIQFGEGGAGTFSDGKLTTGTKDIRNRKVLEVFCEAGAPEEILYEAKPHIGTDMLRKMIVELRENIIAMGGEFLFETKLTSFDEENGALKRIAVQKSDGTKETIDTEVLILAIGHSARDTYEMLGEKGVRMVQKPFSVGVRIEHKQVFINKSQYGECFDHPALGAADYKLSTHLKNRRGVYTFCMCPGGYVVPAASEENMVCVNGMSRHKRDGENANSAILVSITPDDFKTEDPMEGIAFQRKLEQNAYKYGGGGYKAPVQLAEDFIKGIKTTELREVEPTYKPGYQMTNLLNIFPGFIQESLKEGIFAFDKQIAGFCGNGAVLTGVETRSSSPLRILRGEDMQGSVKGIFPCGEGAGYAGGIISSAVDGIRAAERIILS